MLHIVQLDKMVKQLFIDVETTPTGKIRQIGYIYTFEGKIISTGDIKSGNIYERFITALDKMVDKFNPKDKLYFMAYNASFDTEHVRRMFKDNNNNYYASYFHVPSVDVMQVAAIYLMGKRGQPENFKLGTVAKFMGVEVVNSKLHDGLYDIQITHKLYKILVNGRTKKSNRRNRQRNG